ncbi:MAG: hypothetical protein R2857_05775 [Vampirovibrionales bacterium]
MAEKALVPGSGAGWDIVEGVPQGKALDIAESGPVYGYDTRVTGSNTYDPVQGADIVVITVGMPRKPGMSRDDLLDANAKIMTSVCTEIKRVAPNAFVIVVSNSGRYVSCGPSGDGFPSNRVIGMAGVLDTARFRTFIAEAVDASVEQVQGLCWRHGDTMVPLVRYTNVAGILITELWISPRLMPLSTGPATVGPKS